MHIICDHSVDSFKMTEAPADLCPDYITIPKDVVLTGNSTGVIDIETVALESLESINNPLMFSKDPRVFRRAYRNVYLSTLTESLKDVHMEARSTNLTWFLCVDKEQDMRLVRVGEYGEDLVIYKVSAASNEDYLREYMNYRIFLNSLGDYENIMQTVKRTVGYLRGFI